jgi:preprotein translocase subunit YajC
MQKIHVISDPWYTKKYMKKLLNGTQYTCVGGLTGHVTDRTDKQDTSMKTDRQESFSKKR